MMGLFCALQAERDARPGDRAAAGGQIRFRLPSAADIKATLIAGQIPESKLKDSITLALTRMAKEGQLATADPVPAIITKLFPAPGVFDEVAFAKVVDVTSRDKMYKKVSDAETKVNRTDKPKLKAAMDDAVKLIDPCVADATGLTEVFGSKVTLAKDIYKKAKLALFATKASMDTARPWKARGTFRRAASTQAVPTASRRKATPSAAVK